MNSLEQLKFQQRYTCLPDEFHSFHPIAPLHKQRLLHFNPDVADLIGLDTKEAERNDFVDLITGIKPLAGSEHFAMCYAGHQFGHYVPRLGDGRAIFVGQISSLEGRKWDLQLKGAGQTLYSRNGDGRAVLRSSIREYLCSAAMQGLGVPTSYALALIGSETPVYRERVENGAMLLRVAQSHIRFGSFEYFYYQGKFKELQQLADFVISHYFTYLSQSDQPYLALLNEVIDKTARMIAYWQAYGFCHGVLNTDNMSIHGITFDYGPFGFLDSFDYGHICNHSDHEGRYAFSKQPNVGLFNLTCLAQALLPLIDKDADKAIEICTEALNQYETLFTKCYQQLKRDKLGLAKTHAEDIALYDELLTLMQSAKADFTLTFRYLSRLSNNRNAFVALFSDNQKAIISWLQRYQNRLHLESVSQTQREANMLQINPNVVLRNHLAQQAIEQAEQGGIETIDELMQVLRSPYADSPLHQKYNQLPPEWASQISVSCSS